MSILLIYELNSVIIYLSLVQMYKKCLKYA